MKRTLFALFLITTLLTALACERRGNATNGSGTGPIVVGYYGDLSGRTSSFGQSTKNGAEMAADEINKAGGIDGRTDVAERSERTTFDGNRTVRLHGPAL